MEKLQIKGSWKSPHIILDPNGNFEIWGRSLPENVIDIYTPVLAWLDAYTKQPAPQTNIEIKLEYFNTSSSKCILDVFKKLEALENTNLSIAWYYEEDDEDMLEAGEDYMAIISIEFEMIEVEEL